MVKKLEEVVYCDYHGCITRASHTCYHCSSDCCDKHCEQFMIEAITAKLHADWYKKLFNGGTKVSRYLCDKCTLLFESGVFTIGIIKTDCGLPVAVANER